VTVLAQLDILDPSLLILNWDLVINKFHIWRLFTCVLFFGPFSFQFLMQMYFFVSFSGKLEKNEAFSAPGDYPFFLMITILCLCVFSAILQWPTGMPLLGPSLVFAILYYWSRREPYAQLSFFSFQIQGFQFPFCLMFFTMLMGGSVWADLVGLAAGHLFYFLKEVCPQEYGKDFLPTPRFIQEFMCKFETSGGHPTVASANHGPAAGNMRPTPPAGGTTNFGGTGYRLGG